MIAPRTSIADRPHRVLVEALGPPEQDTEGGYRETWLALDPPALSVKIAPAGGQSAHLVPEGTVMSTVSYTVTGPYHPGLTTECRLRLGARIFRVTGVISPEERGTESVLLCTETT